jgi:DNA repair protein RadC
MNIEQIFEEIESSDKVPELILRFKRSKLSNKRLVNTEKQAEFLKEIFDPNTFEIQEELILLILDDDSMPVCFYRLAKGTEDEVQLSYKTLFAILLTTQASRFIIAHNHPNDNPLPSYQDIMFSHHLAIRAAMFGISFDDSIIIGRLEDDKEVEYEFPDHYSLRDNGLFFDGGFPD